MKFNWGHGIVIFLGVFLLSMGFVVYKGFQEKNALVEEEYYPKGLEYQKQIERIKNANLLQERIRVEAGKSEISIIYPSSFKDLMTAGTIFFYRPSDDAGDEKIAMVCDSSLKQIVPSAKLMNGKYLVKMNWIMSGKEYYQEEVIHISK